MASSSKGAPYKFHPSKSFKFPKRTFDISITVKLCGVKSLTGYKLYDVERDSAFCHLRKIAIVQSNCTYTKMCWMP